MSRKDQLKAYAPSAIAVIATRTTGPDPKGADEILALAVADGTGSVLFDSLIAPERRKSWTRAERASGITPAMVKGAPAIADEAKEIEALLQKAELLCGYDLAASLAFLEAAGIRLPHAERFDVKREFAKVHGPFDPATKGWKPLGLAECAGFYGWREGTQAPAEDAKASAFCFRELLGDPFFGEPREKPLKAIDAATDTVFWDYGDQEEQVYDPEAAARNKAAAKQLTVGAPKRSRKQGAGEDGKESGSLPDEKELMRPTPAKFAILGAAVVGFIVAGEPEGAAVCLFLAAFLAWQKLRR